MNENLIHVKLEYDEALQSKRDIISSKLELIRLGKIINRYHSLREEELKNKLKLSRKIKELKGSVIKLQQVLPKIKIPKILEEAREPEIKEIAEEKDEAENDLENQLREIQNRLKEIG